MHSIPYRTKQRIRAAGKAALIVLAVLIVLDLLVIVYLGRFVVYGNDGAHIDLSKSTGKAISADALLQTPEETAPEVEVIYGDPRSNQSSTDVLTGYYIDTAMLQDPDAVLQALQALDAPCTVMIDLKSSSGAFYYSTGIAGAQTADSIDVKKVDEILTYLRTNGFSMVARVKAFCDTNFALNNIPSGLAMSNAALWMDRNGYFWLNPEDDTVLDYLKQIAGELSAKGFKEIVFDDFYYPESGQIVYTSQKTKSQLMHDTAMQLVNYFLNTNVTISFGNPATDFSVESESARIYLGNVDGSGVSGAVSGFSKLLAAERQLVFLTGSRDTRFEGYNLLRPLI